LKRADSAGFTFFTNHGSTKGSHLATNPQASVCFPWIELERQVIVTGAVVGVPRDETALYFHSRPRGSQLGAMASRQSTVIGSRGELESRFDELAQEYPEGTEVPLPGFWGGYRVVPAEVEFWQGRGNRLHDRIRYGPVEVGSWKTERLAP
jgi:pyridoxamine 5'-phosphate oxidase